MPSAEVEARVYALAREAKAATRALRSASTQTKDQALLALAAQLRAPAHQAAILEANARDLDAARSEGKSEAFLDRLALTPARIEAMAAGVEEIARLPDPVGEIVSTLTRPNGLKIDRRLAPLGVIGMIYEARPNVTIDAAALCLKSGNACLLRGGSTAIESNRALAQLTQAALREVGLPEASASLIDITSREATHAMLKLAGLLDVIIPRGGEGLIRFVTEHSSVPVIQHFKGVCHIYAAKSADIDTSLAIIENSKSQRPAACNSLETLLIDRAIAPSWIPKLAQALPGVELRGDEEARALAPMRAASDEDWDTEYLELILSVRVVGGIEEALDHIARHGSNHTEAILTRDEEEAARFVREVDASLVLVNASTRFNDGGQLGLGAEMGISTSKLHAYGPMGLRELCTLRWVAHGEGQVRT